MKLGLISDVHGDPVALELAWAHLTVLGADQIVCAGDVVGYGPRPDHAVAFLRDHKIATCRGNHDRWALERGPGVPDEFRGGTPSRESLTFLAALPFDLSLRAGGRVVAVLHSEPSDDMPFLTPKTHPPQVLDGFLTDTGSEIYVTGHSHAPMIYRGQRGIVVNPGSVVSAPVTKSSRSFALLDLETLAVTFHNVEDGAEVPVAPWHASFRD